MSDDALNNKIKEAAEQYHPAYDEDAWKKMELTLDKHMPEKKRRRRFFYLPFLVLLLGGLTYILYSQHGSIQTAQRIQQTKKSEIPAPSSKQENISLNRTLQTSPQNAEAGAFKKDDILHKKEILKSKNVVLTVLKSTNTNTYKVTGTRDEYKSANEISTKPGNSIAVQNAANINSNGDLNNDQPETAGQSAISKKDDSTTCVQDSAARVQPVANANADEKKKADLKKSSSQKKSSTAQKNFAKNFAINISAGPDVSGVSMSRIGRMDLVYGIGFSYAVSKRFTVRTGFYVADKIYSADTTEYKLPYGSNTNYLSDINANCIVYDIPIKVSYSFSKVKKHDWLVSAGLSSYLMKKENYDYLYKYPSGNTYQKTWEVYNQNHHYLSVLDISAGYEYFLSKKSSLIAEPYAQLPLSGIGAGKVKLNSGGILFTLKIKPF